MHIQFHRFEPHALLKNHIEKIWLFESSGKMSTDDLKLVVPNGNLKLTISYQNGIVAEVNGKTFNSKVHDITLTGLINVPVILDVDENIVTETIGIEFNPQSAYRFFHFNLSEIQNQIYSLSDLLGNSGKHLVEQINNTTTRQQKIIEVQQFLLKQFSLRKRDSIFDYCVEQIIASKGAVTIKELENKTGYSSRWLNIKFNEKLGTSPKNLSSIIRFNQCFKSIIRGNDKGGFYESYYDQSHFIKDFKRYTGLSPSRYEKQIDDFGKRYNRL